MPVRAVAFSTSSMRPADTPWGAAVNLDQAGSDEVRDFITGNALRWLRDFGIDGLRLDAVHALRERARDRLAG